MPGGGQTVSAAAFVLTVTGTIGGVALTCDRGEGFNAKKPHRAKMSRMRRTAVFALMVAALIALATIHFSKGEPLPTPLSTVTVRPDTR
jgi:hypothetical protein